MPRNRQDDPDREHVRPRSPSHHEALDQDTLTAWQDYCSNGLHVTADVADAWLRELEEGNDIDPPTAKIR